MITTSPHLHEEPTQRTAPVDPEVPLLIRRIRIAGLACVLAALAVSAYVLTLPCDDQRPLSIAVPLYAFGGMALTTAMAATGTLAARVLRAGTTFVALVGVAMLVGYLVIVHAFSWWEF